MNSTAAPESPPEGRYPTSGGTPRSRRATRIALTAAVIALGLVIAYIGYTKFSSTTDLTSKMVSFDVKNDSTVQIDFTLTRDDPSRPASCIVRTKARDGSETGRREVLVPASKDKTITFRTELTTSEPSGYADVYGCGYDVPSYLKAS